MPRGVPIIELMTPDQNLKESVAPTTEAPAEAAPAPANAAWSRLVQRKVQRRALQRRGTGGAQGEGAVQEHAERGISGSGGTLPHADAIQRSFGSHDVGNIVAHTDSQAASASDAIGAQAYATGNHVAFNGAPDLHTAAHEAAHVVQQRTGVHLKGGVGEAGDAYEQHADAVADAVVRGESAEALLGSGGGSPSGGVQRQAVQLTTKVNPMKPEPDGPQAKEGEAQTPNVDQVKDGKTKEELKSLEQAVTDALAMVTKAAGNCALDNALYMTWMDNGAKAASADQAAKSRVEKVKNGYLKLKESFESDKIIFKKWDLPADNKIKYNNTYAYVRGGEKENGIYLGGSFWVAKNIGIDSKAGTIVHEMTHRLLKTKDHSYGTAKSKDNATNNPAVAADNADNYEHLAESC